MVAVKGEIDELREQQRQQQQQAEQRDAEQRRADLHQNIILAHELETTKAQQTRVEEQWVAAKGEVNELRAHHEQQQQRINNQLAVTETRLVKVLSDLEEREAQLAATQEKVDTLLAEQRASETKAVDDKVLREHVHRLQNQLATTEDGAVKLRTDLKKRGGQLAATKEKVDTLLAEHKALKTKGADDGPLREHVHRLQDQLAATEDEVIKLRINWNERGGQLAATTDMVDALLAEKKEREGTLSSVGNRLFITEDELSTTERQLSSAQDKLVTVEAHLSTTNAKLSTAESQVQEFRADLQKARLTMAKTTARLDDEQTTAYTTLIASKDAAISDLSAKVEDLKTRLRVEIHKRRDLTEGWEAQTEQQKMSTALIMSKTGG